MKLWLNDEIVELQDGLTLSQALEQWPHLKGTYAIALNETFVAREAYEKTLLKQDDHLHIVTPMQGG